MGFKVVSVALAFLVLPVLVAAEEKTPPVFAAELELVKVTVTVRDATGNLVTNLRADDFLVAEDGRVQNVQFFTRTAEDEGDVAADKGGGAEDRLLAQVARRERALVMDLGLLIDTSSSMAHDLSFSQQAAVRFLDGIPRAGELTTLFFDRDIRISRYESEHQQGLFERILDTHAGDKTALYDAVSVYLSRVADRPGRKVAVLFTDGIDTASEITFRDLLDMERASSVMVYVIGFRPDSRIGTSGGLSMSVRSTMTRLAEVTGGAAYFPRSYKELGGIYDRILADLAGQYVLGFASTNPAADGKFRKLKVTVRKPGLKLQHREGYVAPLAPQSAKK